MEQKEMICSELVRKIQDACCNDFGVIILNKHDFGYININTDHLQMYDTGDILELQDDNGTTLTIDKSSISRISLSRFDYSEMINLDVGSSMIKFIICNNLI